MTRIASLMMVTIAVVLTFLGGRAISAQDKYTLQVPANRIGYKIFSLGQLKIIQEIITMSVFAVFAYFYMGKPLSMNFLYASLCMVAAAYFISQDDTGH